MKMCYLLGYRLRIQKYCMARPAANRIEEFLASPIARRYTTPAEQIINGEYFLKKP